jgi:signal transduction histidine kinase
VDVTLANTEAGIKLIVSDNGRGLDMATSLGFAPNFSNMLREAHPC